MTKKQGASLLIGVVTLFVRLPLAIVTMYLILRHIQATDVMWLLFYIGLPLALIIELIGTAAKSIFGDDV